MSLACSERLIRAVTIMSSSNCASDGLSACGSILMSEASVALGSDLDAPRRWWPRPCGGELRLHLFHLLLHSRSLFHQFPMLDIILVILPTTRPRHKVFRAFFALVFEN